MLFLALEMCSVKVVGVVFMIYDGLICYSFERGTHVGIVVCLQNPVRQS